MIKKILSFAFCALIMIITLFAFFEKDTNAKLPILKLNNLAVVKTVTLEEKTAFNFLQTTSQSPDGLIYYLVEPKSPASYSVLESMGQAMEYAALIGNNKLFDNYAKITHKYFKNPRGYYYWKIDVNTKTGEPSTALVDDLRLIRAYFIAKEQQLGKYDAQLENLSETILKFDIDDNGYPCDYYDGTINKKANEVSLFYLDVETLNKLSNLNTKWLVPYQNSKNILLNMPENKYGFYPKAYKIDAKQYAWDSSINMVENLYTAIDAFHAGKNTGLFSNFLKTQIHNGKVYNHYNLDGTPTDQDESTAVYALAARFLALNNENDAANWCYHRVLDFQISDESAFNGGFGDSDTGLVYAFDQLEALLMLRMVEAGNVSQ